MLVCRANYNGMWVAGELRPEDKSCTVSFVGIKRSYEQYQVLQNVDDGARLGWSSWDKYKVVPTGAVACGDVETFIARRRGGSNEESNVADDSNIDGTLGFTYHVGKLDPKDGFGKISIVNEVIFIPVCALFWPDRTDSWPHPVCIHSYGILLVRPL